MATVDLPTCTPVFRPLLSGRTCAKPSHGWHWLGVVVLSLLLHGLAWQGRGWLAHTPAPIQKPKPPVVVTLLPPPKPEPPKPVVEPLKPLPPAEPPTAKPAPAAKPVPVAKPKPAPVTPPKAASKPPAGPVTPAMTRVKTPPAPPKAVKAKPPPPAEAMGPLAPPVVGPPPAPRAQAKPLPHRRSAQPTRRELEEDPNLPPVTQAPKPLTAQPPFRRPAPPLPVSEPEHEPPVRLRAQTAARPRTEPSSTRDGETLERRSIPAPASPSRFSSMATSAPRSSAPTSTSASRSASSSAANASPAGGTASSAFEGAKANAAYLHNPKPEYPALAMRRQWEGKVVLKVRVLADGTVAAVTVATSSGHEVLDEAALEAVRAWHFVPAKQGGKAVESTVNVPINFNLLDAQ